MKRRKYVIVGTGGRSPMFLEPIFAEYKDCSELVAMCDSSRTRMEYHLQTIRKKTPDFTCPLYPAKDFDKMLRKERPDVVLICTPDFTHHDYIIRSVKQGCDAVCEKPVTVDDRKARKIQKAISSTGRNVRVTFNYRWMPGVSKVKELLMEGAIGKVQHVSLDYLLNTRHGADYFRRWHSQMKNSGGLLVHKSTHHFDLVNWWLDSIPEKVSARGRLSFYGRENALKRGDAKYTKYERYTGTKSEGDPFRLDLNKNESLQGLYLNAEKDSGYLRDRNVFRKGIDIYDTMSVLVDYKSGVTLNYSLNAFCPYEGYHVRIMGDRGCIEYSELHAAHIIMGQSNKKLAQQQDGEHPPQLTLMPLFQVPVKVKIPKAAGSHGGGDPLLQAQIFSPHAPKDKLQRNAGHEQGFASAIIGIAANKSIKTGKPVAVSTMIELGKKAKKLSDLI